MPKTRRYIVPCGQCAGTPPQGIRSWQVYGGLGGASSGPALGPLPALGQQGSTDQVSRMCMGYTLMTRVCSKSVSRIASWR
jgi:hypothetical protein